MSEHELNSTPCSAKPVRRKVVNVEHGGGSTAHTILDLDCGHFIDYWTWGKVPKTTICPHCTKQNSPAQPPE